MHPKHNLIMLEFPKWNKTKQWNIFIYLAIYLPQIWCKNYLPNKTNKNQNHKTNKTLLCKKTRDNKCTYHKGLNLYNVLDS
jgi:hypothetical protein